MYVTNDTESHFMPAEYQERTFVSIFENALLFTIAEHSSSAFISDRPASAAPMILIIAFFIFFAYRAVKALNISYVRVSKQNTDATVILTPVLSMLLFVFNIITNVLVQLESTLVAKYTLRIFDSTSGFEWTIAAGAITLVFLWIIGIIIGIRPT